MVQQAPPTRAAEASLTLASFVLCAPPQTLPRAHACIALLAAACAGAAPAARGPELLAPCVLPAGSAAQAPRATPRPAHAPAPDRCAVVCATCVRSLPAVQQRTPTRGLVQHGREGHCQICPGPPCRRRVSGGRSSLRRVSCVSARNALRWHQASGHYLERAQLQQGWRGRGLVMARSHPASAHAHAFWKQCTRARTSVGAGSLAHSRFTARSVGWRAGHGRSRPSGAG